MKRATLGCYPKPLRCGMTLIELLIVVIILGVLVAYVVPQFGSSTEDAKLSVLETNLKRIRQQIEQYRHQHKGRLPGEYDAETGIGRINNALLASKTFIRQMTLFTDSQGRTSATKTQQYRFGPYFKNNSLPENPFLDGGESYTLVVDVEQDDLTKRTRPDGTSAWKFYLKTGYFIANDAVELSSGTTTFEFLEELDLIVSRQ